MHHRHPRTPVGIDGAHQRTGLQHRFNPLGDVEQSVRIGPHHPPGDRIRRIRAKHQLSDAHPRLRRQAIGHRLPQPPLERLAGTLPVGQHHQFGEGGIGQFRSHRQVKARRALADIAGDNLRLRLPLQPVLNFRRRGAGLANRRPVRQLHFNQHFRTIGGGEKLLVHHAHAQDRHDKQRHHSGGHAPFMSNNPGQQPTEALIARGVIQRGVAGRRGLSVRQQVHPQPGGKNHRHNPGGNQRDTDDPEHIAGVLPGGGLRKSIGHKAHGRHQGTGQHGRRGMAPGIGGGFEAVIPLLHFDHHHFDGNDGIIHQQPQGEDQRAESDAVEVFAGRLHHHKHHGEG